MEKMTNVKALAYVIENTEVPQDVLEKLVAMKASFEKKAENRKPTKTQEANAAIAEKVVEVLEDAGKGLTIAEIKAQVEELAEATPQKVSGVIKTLGNRVRKDYDKKVAYFTLA